MAYVFLFILNVLFTLALLYVCYLAVKQVAIKYGRTISFVFAIFVMSIICNQGNSEDLDNQKWKFQTDTGAIYRTDHTATIIKKTPMFSIYVAAAYIRREKNGRIFPVEAYYYTNGFTSGTKFKATDIVLNTVDTGISYEVYGTTEWSLLGIKFYIKAEQFTGVIPIR